ncbi:unnamed protein product [Rhizophagus irregularis]|nr:unnamed protein product [Rhizophagus irregularis]
MRYEKTGENWEVKSVEASEASEALKESGLTFVKEPKAYSEEEPEIESELDEVRERFEQINIETKKPVGKSVSQDVMVNEIKNVKISWLTINFETKFTGLKIPKKENGSFRILFRLQQAEVSQ